MALGSTQLLTEMCTGVFTRGKGGRCVRLTTLPPSCAAVTKSRNLNFLEPSGPVQACNGTALPFKPELNPNLRNSVKLEFHYHKHGLWYYVTAVGQIIMRIRCI